MSINKFNARLPEPSTIKDTVINTYINQLLRVLRTNFSNLDLNFAEVLNNRGQITLDPSVTSTTFNNKDVTEESIFIINPTTADAAMEYSSGQFFITPSTGIFTVTHQNDPSTDRIFNYLVI